MFFLLASWHNPLFLQENRCFLFYGHDIFTKPFSKLGILSFQFFYSFKKLLLFY